MKCISYSKLRHKVFMQSTTKLENAEVSFPLLVSGLQIGDRSPASRIYNWGRNILNIWSLKMWCYMILFRADPSVLFFFL